MAEGVGFEPTVGCPTLDFESSALNRTQPPFPVRVIVDLSWPRAIIRQSAEFAKVKHHASFAYELENRAPWFKPRDGVAVIITLTGAGIETRIIHEVNYAICNFESFELLEDESGARYPSPDRSELCQCGGSLWIAVPTRHLDMAAAEPISATSKLWQKGVQA